MYLYSVQKPTSNPVVREPRKDPRISLNALTEYLTAPPVRRRRIVEEQKQPADFQVIYYQPAQDAITQFLVDPVFDEEILIKAIDKLRNREPKNDYESHRWLSNVEAIESFFEVYPNLDFDGLSATPGPPDQPKLSFSQIDLSVRPEVILAGNLPKYGDVIGGVKLYFTKNPKLILNSVSGQYPAALLQRFFQMLYQNKRSLHRICFIIDVFGQTVHVAPKNTVRLIADVETACQEIQLWWPLA